MKSQHKRSIIPLLSSLVVFAAAPLAAQETPANQPQSIDQWEEFLAVDGAETLLNGSLDQWRGYKSKEIKGWEFNEGALQRVSRGGDIMTKKQYQNFALALEWKVAEGGNSGIMYRVRAGDRKPYMSGIEYQVLDNANHKDGKNTNTSAGSLYGLYDTQQDACKPAGEWNKTLIIVNGNHVEHWLNGFKVVECELWDDDWTKRHEASKFKGWPQFARSEKGHIALQDHGDKVWYRNIVIRKIQDHTATSSDQD